jgi:hypothetical protein
MSTGERKTEYSFQTRARDLAINVLVYGGVQILLALLLWQILFRSHPQGFALGLTVVGFGSWAIGLLASSRPRSRPPGMGRAALAPRPRSSPGDAPTMGKLQAHLGSAGCGTVLFLSGLVSLGLAFALRVRADMQAGMTWSDIFPTGP